MAILDFALEHARQGRLVFPGAPGKKTPAIKDPYAFATTNEATIISWWQENPNYNICLPGGYEIGPGKYLGFIDIDFKEGRNGYDTIKDLEFLGYEFPETLAQVTPSGGLHLFYYFDFPIRNGVNSLGWGIDTRGYHGYVLGAGSLNGGGQGYSFKNNKPIVGAPRWAAEKCQTVSRKQDSPLSLSLVPNIDQESAKRRGTEFLEKLGTVGSGERNDKAFKAASRLKDFGLSFDQALELMSTHWKSEPALEFEELEHVTASAFKYGQNAQGSDTPEAVFGVVKIEQQKKEDPPPQGPIEQLNDDYAFVTMGNGNRILWFTTDEDNKECIKHLAINAFHEKLANDFYFDGDGEAIPRSKKWLTSPKRRQYDGIIFAPGRKSNRFFNLWRGFSVEPLPKDEVPNAKAQLALDLFLEHIRENVCGGDLELTDWFIGYFAHMIQKPHEKPRVALALRGKKGVGKNVITNCIGNLLRDHYFLTANRRYLSGNFNSHLENLILFVLDEAYWSGDKAAEGILKDLITGEHHNIERKGHEPYSVKNLLRVVIFGNEEWIVPATEDERRFAVFEVGDKRRRDDLFFGHIMDGMKLHGGNRLLLRYLQGWDLSKIDVNEAPLTDALMAQKESTLDPFKSWWLSCLKLGYLVGDSSEEWPKTLSRSAFRDAFYRDLDRQRVKPWQMSATKIGKTMKEVAPSSCRERRQRDGDLLFWVYDIASLEQARREWETAMGGKVEWDDVK